MNLREWWNYRRYRTTWQKEIYFPHRINVGLALIIMGLVFLLLYMVIYDYLIESVELSNLIILLIGTLIAIGFGTLCICGHTLHKEQKRFELNETEGSDD